VVIGEGLELVDSIACEKVVGGDCGGLVVDHGDVNEVVDGISILEGISSTIEGAIDDWKNVLIEALGGIELFHILGRKEVVV